MNMYTLNVCGPCYTALLTASVVNASRWSAIHMKLGFCIAKVWMRNNCNLYVYIRSGSSVKAVLGDTVSPWQISYTAIARGRNTLWAWRPLFRVRVVFFATFPERFMSRPRQTTGPFRQDLKNAANVNITSRQVTSNSKNFQWNNLHNHVYWGPLETSVLCGTTPNPHGVC